MAFTLPDLPYGFDALEPHIDARTMEIHHGFQRKFTMDFTMRQMNLRIRLLQNRRAGMCRDVPGVLTTCHACHTRVTRVTLAPVAQDVPNPVPSLPSGRKPRDTR